MNTSRLCVIILMACIVTPIGVGFMVPQGTEQVREYNTGDTSNISNTIRNNQADYSSDYTGELNNSLWGNIPGYSSGDVIWTGTENSTSAPFVSLSENTTWSYDYIDTSMPYFSSYGYRMDADTGTSLTMLSTAPGGTVTAKSISSAVYIPAANLMVIDGDNVFIQAGYSYKVTTSDPSTVTYSMYQKTNTFKDLSSGVIIIGRNDTKWQNGYNNYNVVFNLNLRLNGAITIAGIEISRSAEGVVSASYDNGDNTTTSVQIGNYDYVTMEIDHDDGVTFYGLSDGALSDSPWNRIINTVAIGDHDNITSWPVTSITLSSAYAKAYVSSAEIVVGKYSATIDKSLSMSDYYPNMEGYALRFTNGSTVSSGAELVISGVTFPIYSGGIIVYKGVQYTLSGMIITVVNDGYNFYLNLNSMPIEGADQSKWDQISFNGNWGSIGVSISEVSGSVSDVFVWSSGLYGLTMESFAAIGLAVAVGSFILCALIGRRSGEKVFWLLITSGCCAAVYLVMLL